MRARSSIAAAVATALLVVACNPAASPTPTVGPTGTGTPAATTPAATTPAATTAAPSPTGEALRIAVVTDVGTVNDKNFNEYSYLGAVNGATAVGAPEPPVFVPPDASQYEAGIDAQIEAGNNVIVTVGFNLERDTAIAAKAHPDVWFIGVDQNPCVDATGVPDPTFSNCTDVATVLPNYILLQFQEDQPGYLAGILAASITEVDIVGTVVGITLCAPCIRYAQGFELGAKSVNPDITVEIAYVTESDFTLAFNDPVAGKAFGETFIQQTGADVVFQIAGKTGNGVLDAVCEANLWGIGVDVDQFLSYPDAADCIVTSAEKKLANAVEQAIIAINDGTAVPGRNLFNAANDGIALSDYHDHAAVVDAATQGLIDTALAGMVAGTLVTCPENCGQYVAP